MNSLIGNLTSPSKLTGEIKDNKTTIQVNMVSAGPRGEKGTQGDSAYEVWLEAGNEGTVEDFLESIKGEEYIHPLNHSANMIDETSTRKFMTPKEKEQVAGYIHDQIVSSKQWVVEHNLNKYPNVTIVDSGGNIVVGDVKYTSSKKLYITFSGKFSGKAYIG